jgi:hypothetical protein
MVAILAEKIVFRYSFSMLGLYTTGVVFHGPGSAQRHPGKMNTHNAFTRKALYNALA